MQPTSNLETSYSVLVWRPFPTPITISHYRRTCSSLATRWSVLFISKYNMTLQTNRFIAIATNERVLCWRRTFLALDEHFWHWTRTHFVLVETNSLVVEMNTLKTRVRISVPHTHSQLPSTSKLNLYQAHLRKCALSRWGDPKVI